jgi:hypothetical protein
MNAENALKHKRGVQINVTVMVQILLRDRISIVALVVERKSEIRDILGMESE